MNVIVHEAKIQHEVAAKTRRRAHRGELSPAEFQVLVEKLRGGTHEQIGVRVGRTGHAVSQIVGLVRAALDVDNDIQLALLAYERGWVVIEGLPA